MGLVVRGNYMWCLVIFVLFMGFAGAKRWGGNASHKGGILIGKGGPSLCNANLTVDVTPFFALFVLIFQVGSRSFQCYLAVRRI